MTIPARLTVGDEGPEIRNLYPPFTRVSRGLAEWLRGRSSQPSQQARTAPITPASRGFGCDGGHVRASRPSARPRPARSAATARECSERRAAFGIRGAASRRLWEVLSRAGPSSQQLLELVGGPALQSPTRKGCQGTAKQGQPVRPAQEPDGRLRDRSGFGGPPSESPPSERQPSDAVPSARQDLPAACAVGQAEEALSNDIVASSQWPRDAAPRRRERSGEVRSGLPSQPGSARPAGDAQGAAVAPRASPDPRSRSTRAAGCRPAPPTGVVPRCGGRAPPRHPQIWCLSRHTSPTNGAPSRRRHAQAGPGDTASRPLTCTNTPELDDFARSACGPRHNGTR